MNSGGVLILTEDQVSELITAGDAISGLTDMLSSMAAGNVVNIPRRRAHAPGFMLHSLSAVDSRLGRAAWKQYTTTRQAFATSRLRAFARCRSFVPREGAKQRSHEPRNRTRVAGRLNNCADELILLPYVLTTPAAACLRIPGSLAVCCPHLLTSHLPSKITWHYSIPLESVSRRSP